MGTEPGRANKQRDPGGSKNPNSCREDLSRWEREHKGIDGITGLFARDCLLRIFLQDYRHPPAESKRWSFIGKAKMLNKP